MQDDILSKLKDLYDENEFKFIEGAYEYAKSCHGSQKRASGEAYIIHPLNVALILAELGMDSSCVSAALLHDVIEDTDCTEEDIAKKFGQDIALMVMGVTKLSKLKKLPGDVPDNSQIDTYRNMFLATAKDQRVLFIKLADRLHNMRTLDALPKEKQQRISKETLNLYATIAGRLGVSGIKSELEDLSMKYLYPEDYKNIIAGVEKISGARMGLVMRIVSELETELNNLNIKGEVFGRPKHIYSVFKKIKNQNKTLDEIYDLIAVRVIVNTVRECYTMLGVIHEKWTPVPGRIKDYIATPKPNMYQSLHTTVMTKFGQMFEIQIRTYEMNKIADYGIAAHWKYKEGTNMDMPSSGKKKYDSEVGWVMDALPCDAKSTQEFWNDFQMNLGHDIYVYTPKGTIINLPLGANCIDFAYKVHTEVGNKCVGAKVDSRMVPLTTKLEMGQIVEIITNSSSKGPSMDWLKDVVTPQAKTKIRAFFKKEMGPENIKIGKDMLEKEARRRGYSFQDLLSIAGTAEKICTRYSLTSMDDLYASVGFGTIKTNQILVKLVDAYRKYQLINNASNNIMPEQGSEMIYRKPTGELLISGMDGFAIKLAKCCNPVPGDAVIGYAARGTGVTVHRADCPNIKGMETERIMTATWLQNDNAYFNAELRILVEDKSGVMNDILSVVSQQGLSITSMELHNLKQTTGTGVATLGVKIKSIIDLELLIKKINAISGVLSVSRNN